MYTFLLFVIFGLIGTELFLRWMLMKAGLFLQAFPKISPKVVQKYKSFDPNLGWKPYPAENHPDNTGSYIGLSNGSCYSIDANGSRTFSHPQEWRMQIATFGDSFCMCREVNDTATWQCFLSQKIGSFVGNYGVGNYGLDQAILRLEATSLPDSVQSVLMAITPWTVERIIGVWLHYANPGNTLAAKPRFVLDQGRLRLVENFIQTPEDFLHIKRHEAWLQQYDGNADYFQAQLKRAPKTALGTLLRDGDLLKCLLAATRVRSGKQADRAHAVEAFLRDAEPYLLKTFATKNQRLQALYQQEGALLAALLKRFQDVCAQHAWKPYLIMIPAYTHVRFIQTGEDLYRETFKATCERLQLPYLDCFERLQKMDEATLKAMYVDTYGHLSAQGNACVAHWIEQLWFC